MANNYSRTSSYLQFDPDDKERAESIVERVVKEISRDNDEYDEEYGDCGIEYEVEDRGVWFYGEEWFDIESLITIAQALLDELKMDEPFYFSWANSCSKLRIDEFGGGAGVVRRGKEPYTMDAVTHVMNFVAKDGA